MLFSGEDSSGASVPGVLYSFREGARGIDSSRGGS